MAITLFLKQQFNSAVGVSGNTATYQYASIVRSVLALKTAVTNTTASGSNIQATQTAGGTAVAWISPPAASRFTMSGLATMNLWAFESNALANATVQVRFCKMDASGSVGAAFFTSSFGTELGTSAALCNWTGTPSDTIFDVNERLVIFVDATNATSQTMGGSQTVTLDYAGLTVGADGDSWISFGQSTSFSTEFPGTENPISESGHWLNGNKDGLDWNDCQTTPAYCGPVTEIGSDPFSDPTAALNPSSTGPWLPNQQASAVVFTNSPTGGEVELRLNTTVRAHGITGYECTCSPPGGSGPAFFSITRWDGDIDNFITIAGTLAANSGTVTNGDVITAQNFGGVISMFKNGVLMVQVVDVMFRDGCPGLGFAYTTPPSNGLYGMSSFSADNIPFQSEPEFIQTAHSGSAGSVNSVTVTLPGVSAAGNLLVMGAAILGSETLVSVADDKLDTTAAFPGNPVGPWDTGTNEYFHYAGNIAGGSATAMKWTKSATSTNFIGGYLAEYGGVEFVPLDVAPSVSNFGSGTAMTSKVTPQTRYLNQLIVGLEDDNGTTFTPGTGFLSRAIAPQTEGGIIFDKVVTSIGTYQASGTLSPTNTWVMGVAGFRWRGSVLPVSGWPCRTSAGVH